MAVLDVEEEDEIPIPDIVLEGWRLLPLLEDAVCGDNPSSPFSPLLTGLGCTTDAGAIDTVKIAEEDRAADPAGGGTGERWPSSLTSLIACDR